MRCRLLTLVALDVPDDDAIVLVRGLDHEAGVRVLPGNVEEPALEFYRALSSYSA